MKKSELVLLKKLVKEEIARRQKINQYLADQNVLEYLSLIGQSTEKKDLENVREMIMEILKNFEVKDSNGIYVCTKAFDQDSRAPIRYYGEPDSRCSYDYKCYKDIETKEEIETDWVYGPNIDVFERSHIVLNPFNASYDDKTIRDNGYEDVRLDFFEESYKNGQDKAVRLVLKKYPRIGSFR